MAKLKDGFYKLTAEAVGSDSYMLLAGGGSKALSDFATASGVVTALGTNGNYVTWTKNGTANNLTVPYATNADKLDNIDSTGFFVTGRGAVDIPYIDLTTYKNDHADYKNYNSGTYSVGRSGYTDTYVIFRATGSTSAIELLANYLDTARLKLRKTVDCKRVSGPWRELAFTSDIPTKVSLLTNDSGYLTQHQSLSNYVTLNGTLTITGLKTFSHNLLFSSIGGSSATDTSVTYPVESRYIGWSGATDWARIFFRITAYNEGHQVFKLGDDSDAYSTWIFEYPRRVAATISTTGINPGVTTDLTLGTKDLKWKNVYSTTFTGNLDGKAKALANYYSSRPNSIAPGVTGDGSMFHFLCTSAVTDNTTDPGDAHILHFNWDNTGGYDFQIAGLTGESTMKIRGMKSGTWQSWATVLSSANYTSYVNTTNFPGLNSVGDITGVTAGAGLSGGGTSGSVTLTNAGVRSTTINGNYLRVNTNGTNADLTIPYATNADTVDNKHASDFIQTSVQMISGKGGTLNGYHQENGWHRIATIDSSSSYGYGSHILYLTGTYNYAQNTNAIIHINTMNTTGKITQVSGYVGFANKIRLVNVSSNKFYVDIHINYTDKTSSSSDTPGTVYYYFLGNGSVTINTLVEKITDTVTAASEVTLVNTEGNVLTSGNYTDWINTTNFPGLNKVGTVTQVIAGTGISVSATTANQSTYTVTNAGVRATTIRGNYLRVNTNGTNADLTIPYATNADTLDGLHDYDYFLRSASSDLAYGDVLFHSLYNEGFACKVETTKTKASLITNTTRYSTSGWTEVTDWTDKLAHLVVFNRDRKSAIVLSSAKYGVRYTLTMTPYNSGKFLHILRGYDSTSAKWIVICEFLKVNDSGTIVTTLEVCNQVITWDREQAYIRLTSEANDHNRVRITFICADNITNSTHLCTISLYNDRGGSQGVISNHGFSYSGLDSIIPYRNNIWNLGSANCKWKNVYATNFIGNATTADRAKYLETQQLNNTNWYGNSYKAYLKWETSNIAKLKIDGYYTKVDYSVDADTLDNIHANGLLTALSSTTTNAISITVGGTTKNITAATLKTSLGLGSNAYTSTAYLPLAGGTMTNGATIKFNATGGIIQTTATTSNATALITWYKGTAKDDTYSYPAQIGWHNTGDTNGAIYLIPHPHDDASWGGSVGLYVSKTSLKYNNENLLKAIKSITRSGTTFTYTCIDGTTGTFTQQDNNSTYSVYGKTINASYKTAYRTLTKGNTTNGYYISAIRCDTASVSEAPRYGSGIAFGMVDTHGYLYTDYYSSNAYIGGGNADKLNWTATLLHSGNSSVSKSGQTLTVKINGVEQSLTNTTYSSLKNPNAIKFKKTDGTTVTYDGSSAADLTAGVNYATSAGTATTISGFTKRATANCTWGTLTASNEYTPVYWGDTASRGGFGFSDKGGKTYMQIDGDYYAQEGTKLVLHTGNSSVSGGGSSGGSSITVNIGGTSKTLTIPTSLPANGGNADTVDGQHFNWNNNKNDHTYLWAASSNGQAYLVHRASMSVNYANSAGSVAWANVTGKPSSYTPSAHDHTRILYIDDRDTVETPTDVAGKNGIEIHFKNKLKSSIPSTGAWTAIVMLDGYSDISGGYPMELGFSMADLSESRPLYLRTPKSATEWGSWRTVLDSNTYTDFTVKKDGTGASGTWGINVTGSAGSVAWGNITGKPTFAKVATSGSYNDLSNRPTIPTVTNYYWANVKISSSSNAATTPTFSTITTTGVSYVATLRPSTTETHYLGSANNRWNGVFSKSGNFSGRITSSVAVGTAPFNITSTTVNTNLNADMLDGLHLNSSTRNNEANKVVRTDGSGYTNFGWINTTSGNFNGTPDRIYASYDGYIRYMTPANFFPTLANDNNQLSITVGGQNRKLTVAYATTAGSAGSVAWANVSGRPTSLPANGGNADTVDGYHIWVGTSGLLPGTKVNNTIYIII